MTSVWSCLLRPFPLTVLGWAACIHFVATAAAAATPLAGSEWVYRGEDGKLLYKTTPAGDRIMDFSSAGYMGGGVALPAVAVKKTVKPSGASDDSAVIQEAIDAVSTLPLENGFRGAVLLSPGTYTCAKTITISASGVVLRGSGSEEGAERSTIKMTGPRHVAIAVGLRRGGQVREESASNEDTPAALTEEPAGRSAKASATTLITDEYVPCGTSTFTVAEAKAFSVGDTIELRRPVTKKWVKFLQMDDLVRDGKPQTWVHGSVMAVERRIAGISGNKITVDVPLSDSYDANYLNPPGTAVAKVAPPARLTQVGVERLHILSPRQAVNHTKMLYSALRLNGQDCWARDLVIEETMDSVGVGGRRITLDHVAVIRNALHEGASKPAEFAPNGDQVLMNRCTVQADNVWFVATGAGKSGPIVLLNCSFRGNGHIEGHQRWTTAMLLDNCQLPGGGIDFKNRGSMGSGHGWGLAWAVAWNCTAESFVIQRPPGTYNWAIGCVGKREQLARPFDAGPLLPEGTFDSHGSPVGPRSLYLAQLAERLGSAAAAAIGYSDNHDTSPVGSR
jgi:hypothetical protein